ncbi:hypothetical protein OOJ91_13935 [Micromonospora lupini]|nr:hypothetical protein [Micromonospora lupini]MCX5066948.1 hypothetical protein [Micromonospora lupini]
MTAGERPYNPDGCGIGRTTARLIIAVMGLLLVAPGIALAVLL